MGIQHNEIHGKEAKILSRYYLSVDPVLPYSLYVVWLWIRIGKTKGGLVRIRVHELMKNKLVRPVNLNCGEITCMKVKKD